MRFNTVGGPASRIGVEKEGGWAEDTGRGLAAHVLGWCGRKNGADPASLISSGNCVLEQSPERRLGEGEGAVCADYSLRNVGRGR